MARLPSKFIANDRIDQMRVGEVAYSVPWAMSVDSDRECWLSPHHTVQPTTGGTVQLRVERTVTGYIVGLPKGAKWQLDEDEGARLNAGSYLPVGEILLPNEWS